MVSAVIHVLFVELIPLLLPRPLWLICTARYVLSSLNISFVVKNFETFREHGLVTYIFRRSNFSKDHRDKTEVPDPLVVEDLISYKLNNIRKLARPTTHYWENILENISQYCVISLANFRILTFCIITPGQEV